MNISCEGKHEVDILTTNINIECVCPDYVHVSMTGVYTCNQQLATLRVALWPCTEPKLGARHRKDMRKVPIHK